MLLSRPRIAFCLSLPSALSCDPPSHDSATLVVIGKLADLVALDGDPFTVEPSHLKDLRVLLTVVGGDVVDRLD